MKKSILILFFVLGSFIAKAQQHEDIPAVDTINSASPEAFVPVEQAPSYPGGLQKLFEYIQKNKSRNISDEGLVTVSFVIEKDGSLTDVKVTKSLSREADAEAIRLVKGTSKWNPGIQNSQPVRVLFNLPVRFN